MPGRPSHPSNQPDASVDPRRAAAQRMMERAQAELAKEDGAKRPTRRKSSVGVGPLLPLSALRPRIDASVIAHGLMLAISLTLAALAAVLCYHMMNMMFVAGRIIALPAGLIAIAALSYASAVYAGVIETTSNGRTTAEHALDGGWQEWFWTLPLTLGMLAVSAFAGWCISRIAPDHTWSCIIAAMTLAYPVAQLSALENGNLSPVSLPIWRTLVTRPLAWWITFAASATLFSTLAAIARVAWRDPPYTTMLVMGPIVAVALLVYGWILGTLARVLAGGTE